MATDLPISAPDAFPNPCAEDYGRDRYGIWQTVEAAGVGQTFRWIAPGRFTMGSPAEEMGRGDNELQREITLTSGFWLADTACTQALFTALMGYNPSEFKMAERPVDRGSFDAADGFLKLWNKQNPEFTVRLPREAEWEYACRAGTTTPFSFGETVTTDQVNFDGAQPYLDTDPKGISRDRPMPVKRLPANSWGLYGMHGNVWEWCVDRYGAYDPENIMNPQGPAASPLGVLRGGSFLDKARLCRSASRRHGIWLSGGFRLASGP